MQYRPRLLAAGNPQRVQLLALALILPALNACTSLGANGPSTGKVRHSAESTVGSAKIQVIPVTEAIAEEVKGVRPTPTFSDTLGDAPPRETTIGRGDVLNISIWEAPPALLFGTSATFGMANALASATTGAMTNQTAMPETMVNDSGFIRVPFAGQIRAAGRSPAEVEREIASRLARKAHDPQVVVQIANNANSVVTTAGEITNNTTVPLTPRGERLLDVIAAAGGVKTPIDKTTVQITRGDRAVTMPLSAVVRDRSQNIRLQPNDVITAMSETNSFTALGATGTSSEVPFESTGITLAQALGRAGGLNSDRADPKGVFLFRFEDADAVPGSAAANAPRATNGKIPVIYTVDMKDPASFFVAQHFPVHDKDVLYVSRAPLSDLQRFVSIVASIAFPVINLSRTPLP